MKDKESAFRWDIQGLRAIAVLSVVIFHISPEYLPGGFLGVDIFFVISGYLIVGFICRDLTLGSFTLSNFYYRRVKRLLPALFAMFLVSGLFSYFLLLPDEFASYVNSLASSLFYLSNHYFYSESGYFDSGLEVAPLLHTWSLSVEEQFYIVIPAFLVLVFKKAPKSITLWLSLLALSSIILSEVLIGIDQNLSFFISPSRFWQFILGGLLSINGARINVKPLVSDLLGGVGLLLIGFCLFFYNGQTSFPGLNAVLPTVATLLIIFSGASRGRVYQLLSMRVGRFFGNTSYSLYLWHWPIIVFYKMGVEPVLNKYDKVIILLLSVLLGYLSWKFIERKAGDFIFSYTGRPFVLTISASLALCAIGFSLLGVQKGQFDDKQLKYASYMNYQTDAYRAGECFLTDEYNDFSFFSQSTCVTHELGKKNSILIGDSHSAHWFESMNNNKKENETVTQITSSGCRPLVSYDGKDRCTQLVRWGFEELIKEKKFDRIILSGRWRYNNAVQIKETIDVLKGSVAEIIVLGPTVEYDSPLPKILALNNNTYDIDEHRLYNKVKRIDDAMELELSKLDGVKYVSILKALCPSENSCITITDSGAPIAFDYGHFTSEGAQYIWGALGL